MQEATFQV